MATMATLGSRPLKKKSRYRRFGWFVITPPPSPFIFFSSFNLGVAMVAMVAML